MEGLEEIPDPGHVVTIDTTTGKLSYLDTPTGGGGGGDENLDSLITVTNQDGAFEHIYGEDYGTSDSYTTVLKDLLSPYNTATIKIDELWYQLGDANDNLNTSENTTSSSVIEVGRAFKPTHVRYTVTENVDEQTGVAGTGTVSLVLSGGSSGTIDSGLANDATTQQAVTSSVYQTLAVPYYGTTYTFKTTVDDYGPSLEVGGTDDSVITSSDSINLYVRDRWKLGASTTDSITSGDASDFFNANTGDNATGLHSTVADELDTKSQSQSDAYYANAEMGNGSYYTWIAYPASWGNLAAIFLQGNYSLDLGVGGADGVDFLAKIGPFDITNTYGDVISYNFYRSTDTGGFADGVDTLTIDF